MKLLNNVAKLFTPDQAVKTVNNLQAGDPDWTYVAVHDPKGTGYSFINIFDEDGELVGPVV